MNMTDQLVRAMTQDKTLRIVCARTTQMVNTAQKIHSMTPGPAAALGRVLTIGVMLGLFLKSEKDKLSIIINGNGPVGKLTATFNKYGTAKGFVNNPRVELDYSHPIFRDMLLVGQTVGYQGLLTVIYDIGLKRPYVGQVNLFSGEIDNDIACYLHVSDQQPSVVRASEVINEQGEILTAGGILIQVMPGAPKDSLEGLESRFSALDSLVRSKKTAMEMLKDLFTGEDLIITDKLTPTFKCDCSKDRMAEALSTIGVHELKDILHTDGKAEVECHFCQTKYSFDENELVSIINKAQFKVTTEDPEQEA